ncbi:MAG: colanic acid biosynthesis glycosyltransferase WcaL [Chloroflexi bacterium]|nr:MAG: colanic acid biosynthesis glycosyltransferase WcaL [Chloroflexota bacterium]
MKIAYIIGTYPGLTTTFIDREIQELRRIGEAIQILSIRRPWTMLSDEQKKLQQGVIYLMPIQWSKFIGSQLTFMFKNPAVFFGTLFFLLSRKQPSIKSRWKTLLHFFEGVYAARLLSGKGLDHLHAHFMDRAATVALVVSRFLKIPYSFTAHASEIYVDPVLVQEKIEGAKFAVTCTGYNQKHLASVSANGSSKKVSCIYHGLDTKKYSRKTEQNPSGHIILSVGQLKERKGFPYLVEACALLMKKGLDFECLIIGEGPMRSGLESQIKTLGLSGKVRLLGAITPEEVIEQYEKANIFVLPAILGTDGDRDGIPNVILESMSMEIPVISTNHSGIPEVVENGVNGLLVPPKDSHALADALCSILENPAWGREMGRNGRKVIVEKFDPENNARLLLARFRS